jgi:hypothetical protein
LFILTLLFVTKKLKNKYIMSLYCCFILKILKKKTPKMQNYSLNKEDDFPEGPAIIVQKMPELSPIVPSKEDPSEQRKIVFLDWDDTILPTYGIHSTGGLGNMCAEQLAELKAHVLAAICFVQEVKRTSDCCIVTNAEAGWVEFSCKKYMPDLVPEIQTLPIMSARLLSEVANPDNPIAWKFNAFSHILSVANPPAHQVISFGDSMCVRIAVKNAVANLDNGCTVKTVKFLVNPTIPLLTQQLNSWAMRLADPNDEFLCSMDVADIDLNLADFQQPPQSASS